MVGSYIGNGKTWITAEVDVGLSFQEAAARLPPLEEIRTVLDRSVRGMLSTFSQVLGSYLVDY